MADTELHTGTAVVTEATADQVTFVTSHQRIETITIESQDTNQDATLLGVP